MVSDVRNAGGIPIIVSPMSRRFYRTNGTISDTLKPYRDIAMSVATEMDAHHIDLWQASITYLQEIGPINGHGLDLAKGDSTHLNVKGSIIFGRMIADLIISGYYSEMKGFFVAV